MYPPNGEPRILSYDEAGGAHYDLGAALAAYNEHEADLGAALRELAGMRLPGDPAAGGVPPRAGVHPPVMPAMAYPNVPGAPGGAPADMDPSFAMGDIMPPQMEPGQNYYRVWEAGRAAPQETPVAWPKTPVPPGMEPMYQTMKKVLWELSEKLKCGTYFVQPQTHLAPMLTAINVDVFTRAAGVSIPYNVPTTIVQIDVPDRFIVVLDRFGMQLDDHLDYPLVTWSMQRNEAPLRSYGNFDLQLGRVVDPTKFGSPITLKSGDRFRLWARHSVSGVVKKAWARIVGWAFAVKGTSSQGSHSEYHTQ